MGVAPALLATLAAGGRVTRLALDLIFPPRCVGCGEFETLLCEVCRADLKPLAEGCRRCGRPDMVSTHHGWCRDCVGRRLGFASAGSAFAYEGVAQELVVALKYGGQKQVAEPMAEAAADVFRRCLARPGLPIVTWVPSHPAVTRERGYNQAEVLARALACRSEVAHVMPLARKVKRTAHQQALSREERAENLAGRLSALNRRCPSATKPGFCSSTTSHHRSHQQRVAWPSRLVRALKTRVHFRQSTG